MTHPLALELRRVYHLADCAPSHPMARAADALDAMAALLRESRKTIQRWCDDDDFMPDEDAELLTQIDAALAAVEAK